MKRITFLTCGGTIDKDYGVGLGVYDFKIGEPYIKKILNQSKINYNIDIVEFLSLDSLDIKDIDRKQIVEKVKNIKNDRIIITHGTDTMIKTGRELKNIKNKTIILTGSSRPGTMKESDSDLNIGYAMGVLDIFADYKKYGVYIAMNGEYFDVDNVEKLDTGVFKKIS